eukprot:gene31524-6707_t
MGSDESFVLLLFRREIRCSGNCRPFMQQPLPYFFRKAISEILSVVMGQDEGFVRLLLHQSLHAVTAFEDSFPPGVAELPGSPVMPSEKLEPRNDTPDRPVDTSSVPRLAVEAHHGPAPDRVPQAACQT